jgi:glycosyltransferase involved in cell wall biosynthesis
MLFVGNLTRRKAIDLIPAIMHELGSGFTLEYAIGLRTTGTLDKLPNTRNLGRLNSVQVREAYRRADLLLFPTRHEGLPLVALEAMACGTPVVATKCSSLPEVIDDRITGRLCPQDDVAAFAASISESAATPDMLLQMSLAARDTAASRFSLTRMLDAYLSLFDSLIHPNKTH